jgi:hypothetical protein
MYSRTEGVYYFINFTMLIIMAKSSLVLLSFFAKWASGNSQFACRSQLLAGFFMRPVGLNRRTVVAAYRGGINSNH